MSTSSGSRRMAMVTLTAMMSGAFAATVPAAAMVPASASTPVSQAPVARAAVASALPKGCSVLFSEPGGVAQVYENKMATWHPLSLPKGVVRHTSFNSPRAGDDDAWHHLGVTPTGQVYDTWVSFGVLGDDAIMSLMETGSVRSGTTLKGIVDIDSGSELVETTKTSIVYAVTSNGAFVSMPLGFTKAGRPVLGKATVLKAKGLTALRGIEVVGYHYRASKVTADSLYAHTKDGRLLLLTVNRTTRTPVVSVKVLASRGWSNVVAIGVGGCGENSPKTVLASVTRTRDVNALVIPNWTKHTLKGAQPVKLTKKWTRSPITALN